MEVTFHEPVFLIFLLSIPLLFLTHFYFLRHANRRAMKFSNFEALKRVTGDTLITKNLPLLILRIFVIMFLVLSAAGPVLWYDSKVSFNDYVLVIDASASMASEDVSPNRLEAAKSAAADFLGSLNSKTQVGVVSFSGISFVSSMLTSNIQRVRMSVEGISILPAGGTDIGSALVTSANVLLPGRKARTIILITDGSDTAGVAVDEGVDLGLDYVRSNHITVYTIGIGTEGGGKGDLPEDTMLSYSYDKDTLERIAADTGGMFFEAGDAGELKAAFTEIASRSETGKVSSDLGFSFLFSGLILLFVEWGLINTKFRPFP